MADRIKGTPMGGPLRRPPVRDSGKFFIPKTDKNSFKCSFCGNVNYVYVINRPDNIKYK